MQGLRVTGGALRGRKLRVDPRARFLDLFAGSGIFAFEAVSRGAREALAVDLSRKNVDAIRRSAADWNVTVHAEAARLPDSLGRVAAGTAFDLVYADPPYDKADYEAIVEAIASSVPLAEGAIVALEHRSGSDADWIAPRGALRPWRTNRYGNVSITFFDLSEPNEHE